MIVTVWDHVRAPHGTVYRNGKWSELRAFIESLPPESLWAPAEYRDGYHDEEHYVQSHAIVLDHDAATVPFAALPELLAGSNVIAHTTKRPGRWRAVIELAQPINGKEYEIAAERIATALECAREGWSPYHMWFPPRVPCIEIKGEAYLYQRYSARIHAWLAGDYDNPCVSADLPRKADGTPDRSAIDMTLVHAMCGEGATDETIADALRARGALSHRTDPRYLEMTIKKARTRQEAQLQWANRGMAQGSVDKPLIHVGPDIDRVADESAAVLASRADVYSRGDALVSVSGKVAHVMTPAIIADALSKGAQFVKATKDGDRATEPPERVCRILSERKDHSARKLRVIAPFPLVRPDGSVMADPGYDPVTESLFVGAPIEAYAMPPTDALAALREPFAEFPYEQPGMVDVIVALVLTIVCRQTVVGNVPIFALDASQKGAGKSLLATSVSLLALGEYVALESWPSDETELDKRLSAVALSAVPYACYDEAQSVGGGALNSLLTGNGEHAFRRLGKSERVMAKWHTVLCVAANNIVIRGDTRRRAIQCRLTPRAQRTEPKLDLHEWIPRNRARLLGAAISLIRPALNGTGPAWPSFEQWARIVAGAIIAAGGHDVTQFRTPDEEEEDTHAREAMTVWLALRWPDGATAREIAEDLGGEMGMVSSSARSVFDANPGHEQLVKEAMKTIGQMYKGKGTAQALGMALRNWRQVRTPDGLYLDKSHSNPPVWRTEAE